MRTPESELAALRANALLRSLHPLASGQAPTVSRDGRTLVNFSSNDYLGLATSGVLKQAATRAITDYGTGSGASRLISGTLPPHRLLEEKLATLKNTAAALTFSTGYATAVGTLTALLTSGDIVIVDKLAHACLIDGARLSGATLRVFPHNELDKLASHLTWARRKATADARVLVVTESVFSMDGDRAPLLEIASLTKQYDALLLVDEAHAFGTVGPGGAGLAAGLGITGQVDLHMGTLSKAAGCSGGYLCASRPFIELVLNRARSFIYSTAPPPANAAVAAAAVDLIASPGGDALRTRLWQNIHTLSPQATSPIIPHIIGPEQAALDTARSLLESGFFAPAVRYPTVAKNSARLRLTITAAHTDTQLQALKSALAGISPA